MNSRSYLFRALVLATLLWVAALFAIAQHNPAGDPQTNEGAAKQAVQVGPPESFGAKLLSDPTAFFTMALAALTAALAGTAAGQIYYLRRADKTSRISANAALKASQAALRSADLAEAALSGAEAPFIFATAEGWRKGDPLAPGDRPGFGAFTLHNYGRSPAIVREIYPGAILCRGMPAPIGFPPPQTNLCKTEVIPVGGSAEPWRLTSGSFAHEVWQDGAEPDPEATHWIIGQVRYGDPFGAQYLTGFCFAYNPLSNRFYGQGGTAYNYRRRLTAAETREAEARDAGP